MLTKHAKRNYKKNNASSSLSPQQEARRLPRDNQRDREQPTLVKPISSNIEYIPVWGKLATNRFDPW